MLLRVISAAAIVAVTMASAAGAVLSQDPGQTGDVPTISDVQVMDVTPTSAAIKWTVSQPATGQVEYGQTDAYGNRSKLEASFRWATHIQQLSALQPGTTYHFRSHSTTEDGVAVASADQVFTTPTLDSYQPVEVSVAPPGFGPRDAPPVPEDIVVVPSRIDGTGSSDVSKAIQRWVDRQPPGSTLVFEAGNTYRMERGIHLDAADRDLTFYGYGATLSMTGCGTDQSQSGFRIDGSKGITILGFEIVGVNGDGGTFAAYDAGCGEWSMGVAIFGDAQGIEVADARIANTHGDALYVACWEAHESGGFDFHHNVLENSGRQLITINQGTGIRVYDNVLRAPALRAVDSEDCSSGDAVLAEVEVIHNWFDTWNWHYGPGGTGPGEIYYPCHAVSVEYDEGDIAELSSFTMRGNHFTGGCAGWGSSLAGLCSSGSAAVQIGESMPMSEVRVTDNTFDLPEDQRCGDAVVLKNVTGGAITGNDAPGQTWRCDGCSDVEID